MKNVKVKWGNDNVINVEFYLKGLAESFATHTLSLKLNNQITYPHIIISPFNFHIFHFLHLHINHIISGFLPCKHSSLKIFGISEAKHIQDLAGLPAPVSTTAITN
jgi:hypothetical protein